MLDEYEEIVGFHSPVAVNDKPAEVNGTLGSMEATLKILITLIPEGFLKQYRK
jgi:hypothetical protein